MSASEAARQPLVVTSAAALSPVLPSPGITLSFRMRLRCASVIRGRSLCLCPGESSVLGSWLTGHVDLDLSPGKVSPGNVGCPAYLMTWALWDSGDEGYSLCLDVAFLKLQSGGQLSLKCLLQMQVPSSIPITMIQDVWCSNSDA